MGTEPNKKNTKNTQNETAVSIINRNDPHTGATKRTRVSINRHTEIDTEFNGEHRTLKQRRQKPQRGPCKTFSRSVSGENIFEFCFLKLRILMYSVFLSDDGAPKPHGARRKLSFPLSRGLHMALMHHA